MRIHGYVHTQNFTTTYKLRIKIMQKKTQVTQEVHANKMV